MSRIDRIASLISEDVHQIKESLYGFPTTPGNHPIDKLISHIDQAYMDFDPKDPKFQQLVAKLFGAIPSPQQWGELIAASSQNDNLKRKLMEIVGAAPAQGQGQAPAPAQGQANAQMAQQGQQPGAGAGGAGTGGFGFALSYRNKHSIQKSLQAGRPATVTFHRGTKVQLSKFGPYLTRHSTGNVFVGELAAHPGRFITFHKKNVASIV